MKKNLAVILVLGVISLACSMKSAPQSAHQTQTRDGFVRSGQVLEGNASWYGGRFHGRRTASGEIFNKNQLTAAHKTLPFGTLLEVHNPESDQTIRVRITDRGPFIKGRIFDFSQEAARQLGFMNKGSTRVSAEILLPKQVTENTLAPQPIKVVERHSPKFARD